MHDEIIFYSQFSSHPRPLTIEEENPVDVPRKKPSSLFLVSEEMIEATTTSTTTTQLPSPDFTDSIEDNHNREDEEKSLIDNQEELDLDADSLDEGVGDVSSDGEHQLSPVCDKSGSSSSCETLAVAVAVIANNTSHPHPLSPVKERIPSRFSFSNT